MPSNMNLFQLTQLAEVSYANLWDVKAGKPLSSSIDIMDRLAEQKIGEKQAAEILSNWSIASHQPNTANGFSATLFKSKDINSQPQYVLAIRGTEPKSFFKDWPTDLGDIVRDGLAMAQIIDLYNYWQQLKAPKNQSYNVATLETLGLETAYYALAQAGQFIPALGMSASAYIAHLRSRPDIVIDEPLGLIRKIDRTHMSTDIYTDDRRYGLDIDPASVTVVGHSLGGHLAAAFSHQDSNAAGNYEWPAEMRVAA